MEISKRRVSSYGPETKKIKIDSIVEPCDINYITVPSLESMAITSILSRLWSQSDIKEAIQVHLNRFTPSIIKGVPSFPLGQESLDQMEERVSEKLSVLSLPNSLKTKITHASRPIGLQLLKWSSPELENYSSFHNSVEHLHSLHWTTVGTIDKAETLKYHINNRNLTENIVNEIFMIACNYCLEDCIHKLWALFPQKLELDKRFRDEKYKYHLVFYWISVMKNELPKLMSILMSFDSNRIYDYYHSINVNMLKWSVLQGNAIAMKYFWFKLSEEERRENAIKWVVKILLRNRGIFPQVWDYLQTNEYTDILCFLLSHLPQGQQGDAFKNRCDLILMALLMDWHWQKFLIPTIQVMWDYLPYIYYVRLISYIVQQILIIKGTEKLLIELWCNSPKHLRKYYIRYIFDSKFSVRLLGTLLRIEDVELIKLLLNDATAGEKKEIIFNIIEFWCKVNIFKIISMDKVHLLDKLIKDILSEKEVANFKGKLASVIGHRLCYDWILDNNWQAIEKFVEFNFSSQTEVENFKKHIIDKFEIMCALMYRREFEIMTKFVEWNCNSIEDVDQFEKELLVKIKKAQSRQMVRKR